MIAPRRFLPSITALLAFEAVARLGSATAAAQELSLTQSAVSRQLKALEDQLNLALISRNGRALVLTPAGQNYAVHARDILQQLARASISAGALSGAGTLNLAILPAFGMHWLAPKLRDFARLHPEVTVNLSTQLKPFDFRTSTFDAAIHFGREDWSGVNYIPLTPEIVVPVCAPSLIPSPLVDPAEILNYDLLHLETRPRGWARWLDALGVDHDLRAGMVFDQFSTMAQAAIHSLGIALLPTFFAEQYLKDGRLVHAATQTSESIGNYYLVWPDDHSGAGPLTSFQHWIETSTNTLG